MTPAKVAREQANLSIYEVAERMRLAPSTVSRIERGLHRTTPGNAEKLALVLGITEEQVLYPERFKTQTARK